MQSRAVLTAACGAATPSALRISCTAFAATARPQASPLRHTQSPGCTAAPRWATQRRYASSGAGGTTTTTTANSTSTPATPQADAETTIPQGTPADPAAPEAVGQPDGQQQGVESASPAVSDAETALAVARGPAEGSLEARRVAFEDALRELNPKVKHLTKKEMHEKFGVLSEMDGRHDHLTTEEFVRLWWKLQDFYKSGTTYDLWDVHSTAMQKDNWELNYQLFVRRLPPEVQRLYEETFNQKYLTFRPPKVKALGMLPPQDYLDVWQAEQPTFYIKESLRNPRLFRFYAGLIHKLRFVGIPVPAPKGGFARMQLSHPHTTEQPNLREAYKAKLQQGQVVKVKPPEGMPAPPRRWRLFPIPRRVAAGESPNYLALKWGEVVAVRYASTSAALAEGQQPPREVQVKVFARNSQVHGPGGVDDDGESWVDSQDYKLEWVAESRVLLGADRVDYIPLGEILSEPESRDLLRFLWPTPLVKRETVKYLYSQDGHEYPWDIQAVQATRANDFTVNALLLPYEFISKREPDLPNTLGKIAIVVGDREFPVLVDFWDALRRFEEAYKNFPLKVTRLVVGFGIIFFALWSMSMLFKYVLVSRALKPYNYLELARHPRYKAVYGKQSVKDEDGAGPWAYEKS